ncbi:YoaK family protein [Nonomuraea sp. NPDC059194]|uniref:YoaK family protein n=1 Tax=Nonomuraea sp. NPDC059194 TaxID=3346764 RepID=UPI0036937FB6
MLGRVAGWLLPGDTNKHGVLPALLIPLTFVTGLVDAVSFMGLNKVFVANMTGNVVFVGFTLAGERDLSLWSSLLAITAFVAGAWTAGRLVARSAAVERAFTPITGAHLAFVTTALVVSVIFGHQATGAQAALISLLAFGMGMQNAVVRKLAVPDMTTTVLTADITGLASDSPGVAGRRRLVSVVAMCAGALCGGLLHIHVGPPGALALALVLLAGVAVAGRG